MAERFEIVEKALLTLLDEKKYTTLRDILITMNPSDVAGLFDSLDEKRIPLLFRLLPKELAAETFVEMEPEAQELLIRGISSTSSTASSTYSSSMTSFSSLSEKPRISSS